jgi:NTP pyrophosphatase (non-canonical NTP hydrolase)
MVPPECRLPFDASAGSHPELDLGVRLHTSDATGTTLPIPMEIEELQASMAHLYLERDTRRGRDAVFRWLTEEVGELAKALRTGDRANLEHEFGDVLAWLASLANVEDIDLEAAVARYAVTCPRCGTAPCACPFP